MKTPSNHHRSRNESILYLLPLLRARKVASFRAWDEESFQQTAGKVPNDTPSKSGE